MATIQLTQASTGNKFFLDEADIIWVFHDTLGSKVEYRSDRDGNKLNMVVSETPSVIASGSETLIPVTVVNSGVSYISTDRMGIIDPTGTYVRFDYNVEGSVRRPLYVEETLSELMVLQLEKEGYLVLEYTAVSATLDTITLDSSTDYSSTFVSPVVFTVFGSDTADMNTMWVTASSAHSGHTTITVTGSIPTGASETGYLFVKQ